MLSKLFRDVIDPFAGGSDFERATIWETQGLMSQVVSQKL